MNYYETLLVKFEKHANGDRAEQMSAYMRHQFSFFGIQTKLRRELYNEIIKEAKLDEEIDWPLLNQCYEYNHREFQYFAVDYLESMQKYLTFEDMPRLGYFVKRKQWWDTIDGLDKIIGNIGLRDKRINDLMIHWSKDEDIWVRRIAINHQRGRKDRMNTKLLETILVNNFGSSEFFINKAIGWILRDYSKTNPEWVKKFINNHQADLSQLSIREGSKYLSQ